VALVKKGISGKGPEDGKMGKKGGGKMRPVAMDQRAREYLWGKQL